ncbi:MAG: esterase-like activity of phytase family protein [Prevotella sp.]|nr:esterase-like activity of phytase family protein [Prevotella sp.]
MHKQHYFKKTVPPGNYSGLAWMGENHYLMVSDKGADDGFFHLNIEIDSLSGELSKVQVDSFVSTHTKSRDIEGIAYLPHSQTVLLSGESDNRIIEYDLDGKATGFELNIPDILKQSRGNYSFEGLTYNPSTHLIWTTTESTLRTDGKSANATNRVRNRLRLQSFSENFQPCSTYIYQMDAPVSRKNARIYAMGVSEIVALDDGRLLILEREVYVSKGKLGSFVNTKLYLCHPQEQYSIDVEESLNEHSPFLKKVLLCQWKTQMNAIHQDFANYEGMCLGPRLVDGRQVLVLCADSQNQSGGLLRDWFRTIVIDI